MTAIATEHVLVVPTPVFHALGHFQGFCGDTDRYLKGLLDPAHTSYRPRAAMGAPAARHIFVAHGGQCCREAQLLRYVPTSNPRGVVPFESLCPLGL